MDIIDLKGKKNHDRNLPIKKNEVYPLKKKRSKRNKLLNDFSNCVGSKLIYKRF